MFWIEKRRVFHDRQWNTNIEIFVYNDADGTKTPRYTVYCDNSSDTIEVKDRKDKRASRSWTIDKNVVKKVIDQFFIDVVLVGHSSDMGNHMLNRSRKDFEKILKDMIKEYIENNA